MIRRHWFDKDFDSRLGFPNQRNLSVLTVEIKVHLNPLNPHGKSTRVGRIRDDHKWYKYQKWEDKDWQTFRREFKSDAEKFLNWPNMQLWLRPWVKPHVRHSREQYQDFKSPRPSRHEFGVAVQCGLTITLVAKADDGHVDFDVLRLKDDQPDFRSYDTANVQARDHGILTNRDVDLWATTRSQNTIAHELGHVLNLDHINIGDAKCVNGNEDICYGKRGTSQRRNWMGAGNEVTPDNADPWLDRIYLHANALKWHATARKPREILLNRR
jgi:hypothetical protein